MVLTLEVDKICVCEWFRAGDNNFTIVKYYVTMTSYLGVKKRLVIWDTLFTRCGPHGIWKRES